MANTRSLARLVCLLLAVVVAVWLVFSGRLGCSTDTTESASEPGKYSNPLQDHPELDRFVERFWIDLSQPTIDDKGTQTFDKAYDRLHSELRKEQSLESFSADVSEWMSSHAPGPISGYQVVEVATITDDRTELTVGLAIGGAAGMPGASPTAGPRIGMTLLKVNEKWAVRSLGPFNPSK